MLAYDEATCFSFTVPLCCQISFFLCLVSSIVIFNECGSESISDANSKASAIHNPLIGFGYGLPKWATRAYWVEQLVKRLTVTIDSITIQLHCKNQSFCAFFLTIS